MQADMIWCIEYKCANSDGIKACEQLHKGVCGKDANKLDSGFEVCQKDKQIQNNYHSCSPSQRLETMDAALKQNGEHCGH
jgi:hypothetical protein